MNRYIESDAKLTEGFDVTEHETESGKEYHFRCKAQDDNGDRCPRAWAVDANLDGTIDTGIRNALLSHRKAHEGGFKKMRRIS